jgi:hypothetical protein
MALLACNVTCTDLLAAPGGNHLGISHKSLLLLLLHTLHLPLLACEHADLLAAPGGNHLVITHKSLLRALLCTALGLPPRQFRAIDIANGAVCMVR